MTENNMLAGPEGCWVMNGLKAITGRQCNDITTCKQQFSLLGELGPGGLCSKIAMLLNYRVPYSTVPRNR